MNFRYPEAGRHAPAFVAAAVAEFHRLPLHVRQTVPLLYWLLGDGTPPYKMSAPDSDYRPQTPIPGQVCGNCRFAYQQVISGRFICSQIRPDIRPEAWCRLWRG